MSPRELLNSLGLSEHADAFEASGINEDLLPFVTERDLRGMGVPEEHHPAILAAVADHQGARRTPTPSNPFQAPAEAPLPHAVPVDDAELARRGTRLAAKILDWLVNGLATLPGFFLIALSEEAATADTLDTVIVVLGFVLMVAGGLGVPIYNWYFTASEGKTIGKYALGIRVVLLDGSPVNFMSGVFMRVWVLGFIKGGASMLSLNTLVSLVDSLFIFGNERRCVHDHIAGTKVIVS